MHILLIECIKSLSNENEKRQDLYLSNHHNKKTIIPVKSAQIQKLIKKFSRKLAISFSAHTFRHTFCTKLAQKGVDIYKIQKLAGHTCIITTSRYLHTSNIELAKVSLLIANINY